MPCHSGRNVAYLELLLFFDLRLGQIFSSASNTRTSVLGTAVGKGGGFVKDSPHLMVGLLPISRSMLHKYQIYKGKLTL